MMHVLGAPVVCVCVWLTSSSATKGMVVCIAFSQVSAFVPACPLGPTGPLGPEATAIELEMRLVSVWH